MSISRPHCVGSIGVALFVGLTSAALAVTPRNASPIRLPLTFIRSNAITTITVGGETVQAGVDTGGNALTLTKDVLISAGAIRQRATLDATDVFGHTEKKPTFRVPVVTIGGQTFKNMIAVEAAENGERPPVPNGIGRQFLSQFTVVVDYASAALTLWPSTVKNAARANCGSVSIPMQPTSEARLAVSEFDTPSGRLRLLWDTGATYSMLPVTFADKRQLPTIVHGASPKFWQANLLSAGHDLGAVEFVILPLQLPEDFDGLLGRNFFDLHVVCLDYVRREVRVR
jgi:hypothetical protein